MENYKTTNILKNDKVSLEFISNEDSSINVQNVIIKDKEGTLLGVFEIWAEQSMFAYVDIDSCKLIDSVKEVA